MQTPLDAKGFDCEHCGKFLISEEALDDFDGLADAKVGPITRTVLGHNIRLVQGKLPPLITTDQISNLIETARLKNPNVIASKLIKLVGDEVLKTGKPIHRLKPEVYALIGCSNLISAYKIFEELKSEDLMIGTASKDALLNRTGLTSLDLTLAGWKRHASLKNDSSIEKMGFLAMKFGAQELEAFATDVIKPGVFDAIGYHLVDVRDKSRAGIIDNILREQIRDSAFVIVDLTHDNSGAYWEAGYAEGLGKPVIYICEKSKFQDSSSHFDTNHCTTVMWDTSDPVSFQNELAATLRRSLNLFE